MEGTFDSINKTLIDDQFIDEPQLEPVIEIPESSQLA